MAKRPLSLCVWTVAAGLCLSGQASAPVDILLARIKFQVGESLQGLPNYTCLETVERQERASASKSYTPVDRLRLEVALVNRKEYFAWPGENQFEERSIGEMIPLGTISSGNFALHAYSVFLSTEPTFNYIGETIRDGRRLLRYDYRVPVERSGYTLRVPPRQAPVGFHGSFFVDRESLDLVRLEVVADDIPAYLGVDAASDTMEYSRVQMGGAGFMLPSHSELSLTRSGGVETRNQTHFSGCRQFAGESFISFEGAPEAPRGTASASVSEATLPPAATLYLILDTPIDSAKSAVGDAVTARLENNVKADGAVVIPKGARVNGRITRLERATGDVPHYRLQLHFFTVEFGQSRADFTAHLEGVVVAGGSSTFQNGAVRIPYAGDRRTYIVVSDQVTSPGEGALVITGNRVELPRGLRMVWRN
ncbi:MAG: hypothetical protein H6Q05_3607 [Acidobacteria bacterium]|nr:hypothetical protein [Acidobacteriota bacterium]